MSTKSVNFILKYLFDSVRSVQNNTRSSLSFGIVSGNQSGDLDSIVSAISYAYFHHLNNKDPNNLLLPFLSFTKKELDSRKDVLLIFNQIGVNKEHLFFNDDLKFILNSSSFNSNLVLVDHNTPQGLWGSIVNNESAHISGIIDHHEDEELFLDAKPRVIQKAGSCSSLVFKYWLENSTNFDIGDTNQIIRLLLAPLVIDTSNLTSKVESVDVEVFEKYQSLLSDDLESLQLESFYKDLKKAKNDIDGLSLKDILSKDHKLFEINNVGTQSELIRVGISSIVKPFEWLFEKFPNSEFEADLKEFKKSNGVNSLVLMTSFVRNDLFEREIGFYADDEKDTILTNLVLDTYLKEELNLEPLNASFNDQDDLSKFQIFKQLKTSYSRKQVAPAIKKAFELL